MATIQLTQVLMVACSARELSWMREFFQRMGAVFYLSVDEFHEQVTDLAMQDEPYFAHEMVRNIFHYFGGIEAPDSIIFL